MLFYWLFLLLYCSHWLHWLLLRQARQPSLHCSYTSTHFRWSGSAPSSDKGFCFSITFPLWTIVINFTWNCTLFSVPFYSIFLLFSSLHLWLSRTIWNVYIVYDLCNIYVFFMIYVFHQARDFCLFLEGISYSQDSIKCSVYVCDENLYERVPLSISIF